MKFRIKEAREAAGLSQTELAKILGVAVSTYNGYELGKHDPKSNNLMKIAKACGTTVDFLLNRETKKEAPEPKGPEAESVSVEEIEALIPLLVRAGYIRDGAQLTEEDFLFINQLLDLADTWFSRKR